MVACIKHQKDYCLDCIREERAALANASVCETHAKYAGSGMRLHCKACDERALAAVGLTPHYERLMVTPEASKRREGQVIAFIGKQLCFFEKDAPQPEINKPIEVMITRALYNRTENGYYKHDSVMALLLREATDDYVLIPHDGFECSGSMCRTTAASWMTPDEMRIVGITPNSKLSRPRDLVANLTPGRTDVWEASNVNSSFDRLARMPLRPGKAWVRRSALTDGNFVRIEGLARVEDGIYAQGVRK